MPDRLIDIGCGPGAFLCQVEAAYPEIQLNALDISPEMVQETRERLSDTAIATVGDSEHMPLESAQYQVVTCNMSIHHYPHPPDALNAVCGKEITFGRAVWQRLPQNKVNIHAVTALPRTIIAHCRACCLRL